MNTAQQRNVNAYMSSIYQMLAGDADPPAKVTFMVGSKLDMTDRMQLATAPRKLDSDIVFVGLDTNDAEHPKPHDITVVFNCSDQVVVHPGCCLSSDRKGQAVIVSPAGLVCRLGAQDLETLLKGRSGSRTASIMRLGVVSPTRAPLLTMQVGL